MTDKAKRVKSKGPKRGFYVAIYGSVGVMLLIAAVIGYQNLNSGVEKPNVMENANAEQLEESSLVNSNIEESNLYSNDAYLSPDDRNADNTLDQPVSESQAQNPIYSYDPITNDDEFDEDPFNSDTANENTENAVEVRTTPTPSALPETSQAPVVPNAQAAEPVQQEQTAETPADSVFTAFEEGSQMEWPVMGEVVMDYSMDHLIYDKTLEHYRTNPTLCIAASAGSEVKATAEGKVLEVGKSKEQGTTVVVDHGNGWRTTYSQLMENVLVKAGDVVKTAQVIGSVGDPTIYSVMLGSHLGLTVQSNEEYVNPNSILKR